MKRVGVVLIVGGVLYAIVMFGNGFPLLGTIGLIVPVVAGGLVLDTGMRRDRREAAELKKFGLRRPPAGQGTETSRPLTANTWGRVLAMSKRTSSRPNVSLILAGEQLLWDGQAVSASALQELEELDHRDQIRWKDPQYRGELRSLFRSSGITRHRLVSGLFDRAIKEFETEQFRAAIHTLGELALYARAGDQQVARGIIDLAGAIEDRVDGELSEECAALIEQARKAMEAAPDSGTGPATTTTTSTAPAEPNVALVVGGGVVVVVGIALIIGNVSGAAPTFAYAGFLTTVVGGLMMGAGRERRG